MLNYFTQTLFWVWILELAVSFLNFFLVMERLYKPKFGELKAHQIGMITRIGYIFIFAYFLDKYSNFNDPKDFLISGFIWFILILAFEWVGSFIQRRPVKEILVGWHIENGYMWPYVLLTYLLSPLIVGLLTR